MDFTLAKKMNPKQIPFLAGVMILVSSVFGQDSLTPTVETDTLASHYAELTAYLEIAEGAALNSGWNETAEKYKETKEQFMMLSLMLASETRDQEMAVKVTHSRIELFLKGMMKQIENDYSNISILMNQHSENLEETIRNPSPVVLEVLQKNIQESKEKE